MTVCAAIFPNRHAATRHALSWRGFAAFTQKKRKAKEGVKMIVIGASGTIFIGCLFQTIEFARAFTSEYKSHSDVS